MTPAEALQQLHDLAEAIKLAEKAHLFLPYRVEGGAIHCMFEMKPLEAPLLRHAKEADAATEKPAPDLGVMQEAKCDICGLRPVTHYRTNGIGARVQQGLCAQCARRRS